MTKFCLRWVQRLLNAKQKKKRKQFSQQYLNRFNRDLTNFVWRFVIMVPRLHARNEAADKAVSESRLTSVPKLEGACFGKRFASKEEVERAMDEYFYSFLDSHFGKRNTDAAKILHQVC
ncbi:hypothetical protein TNIN_93061 [Trichonephila inaurata madagascariensis]|uniref:Uncharacterized protein n=1 Tax=Trichonephila inaurata madagascariensis TaxID=2747483 RepID=A0A8X6J5R8_9ARAC|nr:hypothetical protein TNIN_93061 [Trichonephila inaurata madagascariensis]